MNAEGWLRRKGLQSLLLSGLVWPGLGARLAYAQRMNSGRLQTFEDMVQPIVKGAPVLKKEVNLEAPILADNGSCDFSTSCGSANLVGPPSTFQLSSVKILMGRQYRAMILLITTMPIATTTNPSAVKMLPARNTAA